MSYVIYTSYKGRSKEETDTADTRKEAEFLVGEYRMAFGSTFTVWYEEADEVS